MKLFKTIKIVPFLGCFIISMVNREESKDNITKNLFFNKDSVFASYQYRSPDGLAGTFIKLKYDKSFSYFTGTDIQQSFSSGKWEIIKDTLILNSFIKKDDIPIAMREMRVAPKDSLVVDWVKDLNGDIVKDATVFFNGDSVLSCMPVFDECKVKAGSVKKIKLAFSNNCTTKWYGLKDIASNRIEPILNIDFPLNKYVFLTNRKYLIRKSGIYELREDVRKVNGKEKAFLVREVSFFYKLMK